MGNTSLIFVGDWVKVPDDDTLRKVVGINVGELSLDNGGVIANYAVEDVFLPGEVDGYN